MSRLVTALFLLGLSATASGCLTATVAATTFVAATTVGTVDVVLSRRLDRDCAMTNMLEGDAYCRGRTLPNPQPPVYCYRTLGGVDCHAEADPYAVARARVKPPPVLAMPVRPTTPPVGTPPVAQQPAALRPALAPDLAPIAIQAAQPRQESI